MGFGRNKEKDKGFGFRGPIPRNTSVPAVLIECEGKLISIKNGDNAGKTARLYSCIFEIIRGKYQGGRIWHDIWCNVEPDAAGGDDEVFGSHMQFCDLSDVAGVKDDDGDYITPLTEEDVIALGNRFVGVACIITTGVRKFKRSDKTTGEANSVNGFLALTEEQVEVVKDDVAAILKSAAEYQAKKAVESGASGFEDDDDDGDDLF